MEQEEKRAGGRLLRILVKYSGLMLVLVLMVVIVTVKNPNFIKIENVIGVLRQMSIYGVMGVGMAILIINGYFDLSVGAIAGLCGVLAAMVMNARGNMVAAILTALAAGIAIGVFDGLVVCTTKIPAFVFTLAMTQVVRGAIYLITGGSPVTGLTKGYLAIGKDSWFGVPIPIYVMFAVMFLGWVLLNHTAMGRSIYATGGNPTAARYSRLKINRITLYSFGLCGAAAAVGGILLSSKLQSAQPTMGVSYEMDAISVAAIGGKGKVLIITPAPGMTSLEDRCEGYYDALKDYPDVEVIEQMDPGTQARAGYAQTVENALNANPDVDLILANCGDCALGALSTVELYPDKFADVKIIGYDATPEQVKAMQEGRQIIASMAQNPMNIGSLAVESVQKILAGETVDAVVRTPGGLVTREEEMAKAAA